MTRRPTTPDLTAATKALAELGRRFAADLDAFVRQLQEPHHMTITATRPPVPPAALRTLKRAGLIDNLDRDALTAPTYVTALADKVDAVARYTIGPGWTILRLETLGPAWVIRWDRLTIALRDPSDLELARFVVAERTAARQHLKRVVAAARRPGPLYVVKCPACRTTDLSGRHTPGGARCQDAARDRVDSITADG